MNYIMNTFDNIIFLETFRCFFYFTSFINFFITFLAFKRVAPACVANNPRHSPANRKHFHWG